MGYDESVTVLGKEMDSPTTSNPKKLEEVIPAKKQKKPFWYYLWDTFDKPKEERWFMFKLDAVLMTFAGLGYFIKYLDQSNINSAFVSGMKEDLGLYKNQLNYMQTCWTVGYIIGEIPSNIILTRFKASRWIPCMEIIWSVLTFTLSRAQSARTLYILRFFIGLAESTFYPGMLYIIGSWYKKDELAKRTCLFHVAGTIAIMSSGYLMTGVYPLDGKHGFKGWQWLFLVDGIISLPIAVAGFFFIPDVPEIAEPFYLTKEEIAFARKRMAEEGREERQPYTKAKVKKILTSWHIWMLSLLYAVYNNATSAAAPTFAQFLKASKSPKYTIAEINNYPTTTWAVLIVSTMIYAWVSDTLLKGRRWPPILFGGVMNLICYISLAYWDIPVGWKWTCYILMGSGYGLSTLIMSWGHEICTRDNEERAITIASMNQAASILQAWLPLIVWQQVDAPEYRKGFITASCLSVLMMVVAMAVRFLEQKERKELGLALEGEESEGSE